MGKILESTCLHSLLLTQTLTRSLEQSDTATASRLHHQSMAERPKTFYRRLTALVSTSLLPVRTVSTCSESSTTRMSGELRADLVPCEGMSRLPAFGVLNRTDISDLRFSGFGEYREHESVNYPSDGLIHPILPSSSHH